MRRYESLISGWTIKSLWEDHDIKREYVGIPERIKKARLKLTGQAINEFTNIDEMNWFEYNDYSTEGYNLWGYPDFRIVLLVTGKAK